MTKTRAHDEENRTKLSKDRIGVFKRKGRRKRRARAQSNPALIQRRPSSKRNGFVLVRPFGHLRAPHKDHRCKELKKKQIEL